MLKLNVGCDRDIKPGYVNIDIMEKPGVDLVADARHLPYRDGEVDFILCSHMLEHLMGVEALKALKEFYRVLKPMGCLEISFPDMKTISKHWATLSIPHKIRAFPAVLGGGPARGLNQIHLSLWDDDMALFQLYDVGFNGAIALAREIDIDIAKYWLTVAVWKGSIEDTKRLSEEWVRERGGGNGSH